jgi:hypothetical protein
MKVDGQRTTHLSSFSWFFSPLINTSSKHWRWPPPQSWPSSCLIYFSITDRAWLKLLQVMNINICCSNLVIWLTRAARHLSRDISRESCRSTHAGTMSIWWYQERVTQAYSRMIPGNQSKFAALRRPLKIWDSHSKECEDIWPRGRRNDSQYPGCQKFGNEHEMSKCHHFRSLFR